MALVEDVVAERVLLRQSREDFQTAS